MTTLDQKVRDYERARREFDNGVLSGEEQPPSCFTCKTIGKDVKQATHVTTSITPAGYRAYQCEQHTPKTPKPLWGSDPGWQSRYVTIAEARAARKDAEL